MSSDNNPDMIFRIIVLMLLVITTDFGGNINYRAEIMPTRNGKQQISDVEFNGDVFSPTRNFGLTCSICIVMDKEFFSHLGEGNSFVMTSKLQRMINYASWIYRSTDWNNDGIPENIGFQIKSIVFVWNPFPMEEEAQYAPKQSMEMLLQLGEVNFKHCCLGLGLTMREFHRRKQVGSSFEVVPNKHGGICNAQASFFEYKGRRSAKKLFTNTILISGAGTTRENPLELSDLILILIHELGHTFGVTMHDNDSFEKKDEECSGLDPIFPKSTSSSSNFNSFDENRNKDEDEINRNKNDSVSNYEPLNGRYIMWAETHQGKKWLHKNNFLFSPCSKKNVTRFLEKQSILFANCLLRDRKPFCGNGILEDSEECDCGNELSCKQDQCCGSRSSANPCRIIYADGRINRTLCPTYLSYPSFIKNLDSGRIYFSTKSLMLQMYALILYHQ